MADAEYQSKRNTLEVWYSGDLSLSSTVANIKDLFVEQCRVVPTIGYHPEPAKRFLVTSIRNIYWSTAFFAEEGFKVDTNLRCLDGYLGAAKYSQYYMSEKVANLVKSVDVFSQISWKEPQSEFSGLTYSLHN